MSEVRLRSAGLARTNEGERYVLELDCKSYNPKFCKNYQMNGGEATEANVSDL